jgi:hypothetical protein
MMKWMFKAPEAEVEQATNRGVELIDKPELECNQTPSVMEITIFQYLTNQNMSMRAIYL